MTGFTADALPTVDYALILRRHHGRQTSDRPCPPSGSDGGSPTASLPAVDDQESLPAHPTPSRQIGDTTAARGRKPLESGLPPTLATAPMRWPSAASTRGTGRIVLGLPRVSPLDHEVPTIAVEAGPVEHVVDARPDGVPVGHQPVLVVADEQVGVLHAEEPAGYALPRSEPLADRLEQLPLPVLL